MDFACRFVVFWKSRRRRFSRFKFYCKICKFLFQEVNLQKTLQGNHRSIVKISYRAKNYFCFQCILHELTNFYFDFGFYDFPLGKLFSVKIKFEDSNSQKLAIYEAERLSCSSSIWKKLFNGRQANVMEQLKALINARSFRLPRAQLEIKWRIRLSGAAKGASRRWSGSPKRLKVYQRLKSRRQ